MTASRAVVRLVLVSLLGIVIPLRATGHLAPGHVPAVVKQLRPTGSLAGETRMELAVGLPLRDTAQLQKLMRDIYDPASPSFHHFLTPEEFTARFSPSPEDYRALVSFASKHHLTVVRTHSNRMLLDIRAAAADVEKTFNLHFRTYHRPVGGGDFFAPDVEPSVDEDVVILDVTGLSNYRPPHPMVHEKALRKKAEDVHANAGSAAGGAFMGTDLRSAYVPGVALTGTGQTVGLVEFDGYYASDIAKYESQAGLAAVGLQNILLDGYDGTPTSSGSVEVSLDIEMAISMAPGLSKIIVYEAGSGGTPNDVLNRIVTDNEAKEIGCSWTWTGGPSATSDQIFQQMALQGQSFFCASGDADAYAPGALDNSTVGSTPADSPYITSVGATTLATSGAGGSWISETVWNWGGGQGSGGGTSSYYAIPVWQQGISMSGNGGSATMRNIPDVAMAGDNIYVTYGNGSSGTFGGTSCAAPLWAGFLALVNQQAAGYGLSNIGFLNPSIYSIGQGSNYTALLHDIATGNNTSTASPHSFFATAGYDLCSGWGSPHGSNLINALAPAPDALGILTTNSLALSGPSGGPFTNSSGNFIVTNFGAGPVRWAVANNCSWLDVPASGGTLPPGASTTLTASLNAAASSLPDGSYTSTLWFTNMATGYATSRKFTLTLSSQLVQNGGFETGSFAGWTQSGNTAYSTVMSGGAYTHSSGHGAQLGPSLSPGYLSQTISTVPGSSYIVSLWLYLAKPGGTPNQFGLSWDGAFLCNQTNMGATGWTNLQFMVKATAPSTPLQLSFRNDPSYFGVDDVSVLPFTAPALQSLVKLNNTVQLSLNTTFNLTYQLQYITNLSQTNWLNLGAPFVATNSITTFTDNAAVDAQRFYRVLIHP